MGDPGGFAFFLEFANEMNKRRFGRPLNCNYNNDDMIGDCPPTSGFPKPPNRPGLWKGEIDSLEEEVGVFDAEELLEDGMDGGSIAEGEENIVGKMKEEEEVWKELVVEEMVEKKEEEEEMVEKK